MELRFAIVSALFCASQGRVARPCAWIRSRVLLVAGLVAVSSVDGAVADNKVAIYPQLGHHFTVTALAFSPDGKTLASGSVDRTIKLWDVTSGREVRTLDNNGAAVFSVAFSPDGRTVASSGEGGGVTLWNAGNGARTRTLAGNSPGVEVVAFPPNGHMLASGEWGGDVRLWDTASGRGRSVLRGHQGPVLALAFSPDGKTVASAGADKTIRLWDTESGRWLRTLRGHTGAITSVAFTSGGAGIVSYGADATIRYWDARTGNLVRALSGNFGLVTFAPDGKFAALGFTDGVALFDVAQARVLRDFTRDQTVGDFPFETAYAFAFSRNGLLAAGSKEGFHIAVWNATDGRETRALGGHAVPVYSMALSADGKLIASTNVWDCAAALWDASTGHELRTVGDETASASALAFSLHGTLLATGQRDRTIALWDAANGHLLRQLRGHADLIRALAFSPDGTLLASAGEDNTVRLWNASRGQVQRVWGGRNARAVAFSPDGRRLAITGADRTIQVLDPGGGSVVLTLTGLANGGDALAYSPDGTLASVESDDSIRLWSSDGRLLRILKAPGRTLLSVAFSADGKLIAAGSFDHTITLFDAATGRLLATLSGHSGFVSSVAFSRSKKALVSGSWDGTIREWSVPDGRERAALIADSDTSIIASPAAGLSDAEKDTLRHSYIVVTPEGFFDSSSARVEDDLNVRIGNSVFGISSFRDNFYRPDLVTRALAGEDVSRFGSIDQVKLSPEVEFVGLPATTTNPDLKMTLRLTNGGGGFGPVRVFWNGTIIEQDSALPSSGTTISRSYSVPLQGGDNSLRATAFNADGSMWSDASASITMPLPRKVGSAHGTLHALVIGIREFPKAPSHRLAYPADDANLIATTLTHKAAPLFAKIDVRLLTLPAETDKAHIVQALKAMQTAAAPGDEFVLYVASHGIVFGDHYYVATSDIDPAQPATLAQHALSAGELSDLLANIRASKKLVILDTCDSGAARDTLAAANNKAATHRAATVLSRDFGFTVLAATTSNQDALEGGYNGHGLFTYVVNDGLSGKAADAAGIVSSFKLADYVNDNVPTLAKAVLKRMQQPTAEKSGQAFSVTKVR